MRTTFRTLSAALVLVGSLTVVSLVSIATVAVRPAGAASKPLYYVALGDSYAEGYQPTFTDNSETLRGYTNQVPSLVASKKKLTLVNFGCGGATSNSILNSIGCGALATNAPTYPNKTQAQAAIDFINAHKGQIGLVTISIGGNDFDSCLGVQSPVDCVVANMPVMQANITILANKLRDAVGPTVPMIATTYPDIVLGLYVGSNPDINFANLSLSAFSLIINPDMRAAYAPSNTAFIDITAQTGAYTPLTQTTTLAPYGTIPQAVANVCTLTWFCTNRDIHPRDAGYTFIAHSVATQFLKMIDAKKTKAPTGVNDAQSVSRTTASSVAVLANDTVVKGDSIIASTVRLCGAKQAAPKCTALTLTVPGGTYAVNQATGAVGFTPTSGYQGTLPVVSYQAYDVFGQVDKGKLTLTFAA